MLQLDFLCKSAVWHIQDYFAGVLKLLFFFFHEVFAVLKLNVSFDFQDTP